ncbi:unnamed protein product [Darwinula stevensoni]|uniref:Cytochrome c oxidase subunit n=1 Tax=Darwinula stevensoni TaxID=69355 RepID=A0A7R9A3W9_9CRUS|nr:unnamed protein product [Darwinula stevensoni]CAG0888833.1 unnamed protein product [Darwinula stevensoni]
MLGGHFGSLVRRMPQLTRGLASSANQPHAAHEAGMRMWRQLSIFVALPAVGLCMLNAYLGIRDHPHARPEFVPYEHMRIRSKRFPWGDGNKSLFHNPHMNALPDGYEEGDDHHHH